MWSVNRPHGRSSASTTDAVTANHRTGLHNRRQLTTLTSTDALSERHCVYTQACHEAKSRQMRLIIVTNDENEDWWRRGPDMIGPRQEITKEFFDSTGQHLFLMRASDLLNRSQVLDVEVNPQSARDADVNRSDIAEPGKWTAKAVEMLLQRLRGEGRRDIADIINAAAAAEGSISR
jgi:hypothetical protein